MNFGEKLDKNSAIYSNLTSSNFRTDYMQLSPKSLYKKYYWFLPESIIENMNDINNKIP